MLRSTEVDAYIKVSPGLLFLSYTPLALPVCIRFALKIRCSYTPCCRRCTPPRDRPDHVYHVGYSCSMLPHAPMILLLWIICLRFVLQVIRDTSGNIRAEKHGAFGTGEGGCWPCPLSSTRPPFVHTRFDTKCPAKCLFTFRFVRLECPKRQVRFSLENSAFRSTLSSQVPYGALRAETKFRKEKELHGSSSTSSTSSMLY